MWVAFANAKATHIFFSKNINVYAIFNDQSFNDALTYDIVSFEQLGPEIQKYTNPCMIIFTLTFTNLWANAAEDKLMIFFLFFPE